jgi:propanol-preferring alcohol dehydrogenase
VVLELALSKGAAVVIESDADAASQILDLTDGYGAEVEYDVVGVPATVALPTAVVSPSGAICAVGLRGGSSPFNAGLEGEVLPWGVNVQRPYGGTAGDQAEVLTLVRSGKVKVEQ